LASLAFAALAAAAPALKPWTSDDILALRSVTDPQVSPDGRTVAYVVSSLSDDKLTYQTDVWLVPVAGGAARRLTTSPAADEHPRWSPDGRTLAFLSDRPHPGAPTGEAAKDDEGKRQIWMIHPDGGEAWVLSTARGGVSDFEWSRDGRRIAFVSSEPKSDAQKKKEKDKDDAWTPGDRYHWDRLWVMDVASSSAKQLTSGDNEVGGFSFSPDGRTLAVAIQPTPLIPDEFNSDLYTIPADGGPLKPLVKRKGVDTSPSWSPDGKWIAFISQDGHDDEWFTNISVSVVPASGGAARSITRSLDETVEGLGPDGPNWTPDSKAIVFFATLRTTQQVMRADLDGHVSPITSGPGVNSAPSLDGSGSTIAYLSEDSEHPREIWTMPVAGGTPRSLTDTNPEAREHASFHKELVTWKGPDGLDIEGLLLTPPGVRKGQRVPLVLNVHGGPSGTHMNTCTVTSRGYPYPLFLQKGWAVLLPNPRGSGGYGESFRAANVRDWGGKDYEDLMLGVDAMIQRGIADPARLLVCGWSYGGFMTSTIVTRTDRFRAAVVGAGVIDLGSMVGTCDIPDFNRSYFGAWPWEDPQTYVEHSALYHAGRVHTPTLILHGEADDRVPTSQGWEFYTALHKIGVPTDLVILPRSPHGPREPKMLRTVHEQHLAWFERWLSAPAPKAPARAAGGARASAPKPDRSSP
jgi:dipeptidyl aminopeptidase/acylaminoacyl peptidase